MQRVSKSGLVKSWPIYYSHLMLLKIFLACLLYVQHCGKCWGTEKRNLILFWIVHNLMKELTVLVPSINPLIWSIGFLFVHQHTIFFLPYDFAYVFPLHHIFSPVFSLWSLRHRLPCLIIFLKEAWKFHHRGREGLSAQHLLLSPWSGAGA